MCQRTCLFKHNSTYKQKSSVAKIAPCVFLGFIFKRGKLHRSGAAFAGFRHRIPEFIEGRGRVMQYDIFTMVAAGTKATGPRPHRSKQEGLGKRCGRLMRDPDYTPQGLALLSRWAWPHRRCRILV